MINEKEESSTGVFYKFTQNEQILIKQPPVAVYSPTRFKYSDDGWGYIGNIQRYEEIATSQETGEPALIYLLGLGENQLWGIIGNIKRIFSQWSLEIDENLDILDGIFIDVNINSFSLIKPDGTIELRKKIRFSIVKDGIGKDAYRNRLEWLKNKVNSTTVQTDQTTSPTITIPNVEPIEKLNFAKIDSKKSLLTQLREMHGPSYEETVNRVSGIKKFANPGLNEEKYFKIKEPMKFDEKYKIFSQIVDEVIPIIENDMVTYVTKLDANGKPRENLPHNLTKNACSNIEGLIIKKLEGREPDEDLNISINSIWKVKGVKNPILGEGFGDVLLRGIPIIYSFRLMYLDEAVVEQIELKKKRI